jgi:hypothetical protein
VSDGTPAWHADPSGRHQYRWWDGRAYTDQVADGGVTSTDAGPRPPAPQPEPQPVQQPWPALSPTFGAGAAPVPPTTRKAPLVLAVVLALAVAGAVGFVVLRDDEDSGTGTFEGAVDADSPVGIHDVTVPAGSALTVELEPDGGLDAVVGLVVDEEDADRIEEFYGDLVGPDATSIENAFGAVDIDEIGALSDDEDQAIFRTDVGYAGDDELVLLVTPIELHVQVVVAPFEEGGDDEGAYEIAIETLELDVDEDDDVEDLLEAVEDDEDVPADFREFAEEQLDAF